MSSLDGIAKPSNSNKKLKNSPKSEKDLGIACHTPPLKPLQSTTQLHQNTEMALC